MQIWLRHRHKLGASKGQGPQPYEFGCKVSIATPVTAPKGGQFVLHAKALHGNPFDGHTGRIRNRRPIWATILSSAPCANSTIGPISPSSSEAAASLAWLDQHALDQRALTPNRERRVRVHEPKLLKATNEASMG